MKDLLNVLNKKFVVLILVLSMLFSLQGCMRFYKVRKVSNVSAREMEEFITQKKFFIIHQDNEARYLLNAGIQENVITGELVNLKDDQMKFKSTRPKGATRYRKTKKHNEAYVTNEVHLYLQNSVVKDFGSAKQVKIPLSDIAYTNVYLKARGRTTFSWVAPGVLLGAVAEIVAFYAMIAILANGFNSLEFM